MPASTPPAVFRFGPFELDAEERVLRREGQPVPLRARPFDLLRVLLERAGRLVSKDELLDLAWPGVIVEENNLQVQVSVLRKLLGNEAIATVPGRGYRFVWALQAPEASPRAASPDAPAPAAPPAPLLGRDEDLRALSDELRGARLVNIVGSGGIGKTRLAQALAQQWAAASGAPCAWIDLAPVHDGELLPALIAGAIGIEVAPGQAAWTALENALRAHSGLVVLDNAEHLLHPVAEAAQRLLEAAPRLRLLITSQAALHVAEERVHRLGPLALPRADADVDEARAAPAVALFVARVQALDRRFVLNAVTCGAVVQICRQLDGIALALELAAARVPLLGVSGVAARLGERFRLLAQGRRDAPTRQQSLQAVFDWSHQLLGPLEQRVFRRLGALIGPFTLAEACAVARDDELDDWQVLDLLGVLVDRSLVAVSADDPPFYSLLETGRAYALAHLQDAAEHAPIARAGQAYEAAGDAAAAASANARALSAYAQALELAELLPSGPEQEQRELQLCLKLGPAIQTALGPAHPRCEEVYRRAVERSRSKVPQVAGFQAMWGYWQFLCMCGRDREAAPLADDIVRMAARLNDDGLELEAAHAALTTQQLLGNAPAMLAHAQHAIGLYRRERHHALAFSFGGHDPGICALGQAAVGLWLTGCDDAARAMAARAEAAGAEVDHAYSRAVSFFYPAMAYAGLGDLAEVRRCAEALTRLSEQHGMQLLCTEGRFFLGHVQAASAAAEGPGARGAGIDAMRGALAEIEASGELAFVLFYIALLAEALVTDGRGDEAMALIERGLAHARAGQGFFLPEVHRWRAVLRGAASGRLDLVRARDLAEAQGAVALARRAVAAMAAWDGAPQSMIS